MLRVYSLALLVPAVLVLLNAISLLAFGADASPCLPDPTGC